jgi:hypothetical protein
MAIIAGGKHSGREEGRIPYPGWRYWRRIVHRWIRSWAGNERENRSFPMTPCHGRLEGFQKSPKLKICERTSGIFFLGFVRAQIGSQICEDQNFVFANAQTQLQYRTS